ncbi:MAG: hypothetical protein OSB69_06555, partial [Alphaproteobacteria bacterium]|nr:hypothetical protein [Alphaproteobacteria bacterium]
MAEAIMNDGVAPLDGIIGPIGGPANAGAVLSERRHRGKLVLRGDLGDKNFRAGATEALGMAPPTAPNTAASSSGLLVI